MKIQKQHAMAVCRMFSMMAVEDYGWLNDQEEDLVGRCLGFAIRHGLIEEAELKKCKYYSKVPYKETARLDLEPQDIPVILDMYTEVANDPFIEMEGFEKTAKYLKKVFPDGSNTEDSPGE